MSPTLLPNYLKKAGWVLLLLATMIGILIIFFDLEFSWLNTKMFAVYNHEFFGKSEFFKVIETNLTNTVVGTLFIIGGLLVGFSKEKTEDEFIEKLRLSSLIWAVWLNSFLLILSFIFIYGSGFLSVMIYNMFTVLIFFILRFNVVMMRYSIKNKDGK